MLLSGLVLALAAGVVLLWAVFLGHGSQTLSRVTEEPVATVSRANFLSDQHDRLYLPDDVTPEAVDRAVAECTFIGPDGSEIELWWQRSPMFGPPKAHLDGRTLRGTLVLDFADDRVHRIACSPEAGGVYLRTKPPFFGNPWTVGAGLGLVGGLALAGFGIRILARR